MTSSREHTIGASGRFCAFAAAAGRALCALVSAAMLAAAAGPAAAQTFGQFTTAAISPLGEGSVFFTAADNEARAGIAARFRLTERGDAGVQIGYDRKRSTESFGFGLDYKRYLVNEEGKAPLDVAWNISYGWLGGDGFVRSVIGAGAIISGNLGLESPVGIEPYGSVGFAGTIYHRRPECRSARPPGWPCREDQVSADSVLLLRGGVKLWFNEEIQLYVELKRDETTSLGAALNVVF